MARLQLWPPDSGLSVNPTPLRSLVQLIITTRPHRRARGRCADPAIGPCVAVPALAALTNSVPISQQRVRWLNSPSCAVSLLGLGQVLDPRGRLLVRPGASYPASGRSAFDMHTADEGHNERNSAVCWIAAGA